MYCTNCGNKLGDNNNFCNKCGKEIKRVKATYCTRCGSRLNPKNGLCIKCIRDQKINGEQPIVVQKKNYDNLKLNILFNLGVIMVLIAGFVLATTNWQLVSDTGKIVLLVGLSIFFLLMHLLCEKKLNLKVSAYVYWFLSMAFIMFTGISLTYLQIFGHWFSLAGPGKFLCLAALALLFTLLAVITRIKYRRKWLSAFIYLGFVFVVFFVCRYFGLGWLSNLAILSLLVLLLYLYTNESNYRYATFIICLAVIIFEGIFVLSVRPEYNVISGTAITVCNGLLLFLFGYLQKNKAIKVLSAITLFVFFIMFLNYALIESSWTISIICGIMFLLLLMVLIINAINENNDIYDMFSRTSKLTCLISISVMIIFYFLAHNYHVVNNYFIDGLKDGLYYHINLTICSFILLLSDIFCIKDKTTVYRHIYAYLFPVFTFIFAFNAISLLTKYVNGITFAVCTMFFVFIVLFLYMFQKKSVLKDILHAFLYFLLFIAMYTYIFHNTLSLETIEGIVSLLLPSLAFILYFHEKEKNQTYRWLAIVVFAISFYSIVGFLDVFGFGELISAIITCATFALIVILFLDDLVIRRFIPWVMLLPISDLLKALELGADYQIIIGNACAFVVLFIFAHTFNIKTRNILLIVGSSILLFIATFTVSIPVNIYASIVSILLIIYDLFSEKIKGLFTVGIVFLIINTLFELRDLWNGLSIWTYLLIAGIIIIVITTVKLAKSTNKKD